MISKYFKQAEANHLLGSKNRLGSNVAFKLFEYSQMHKSIRIKIMIIIIVRIYTLIYNIYIYGLLSIRIIIIIIILVRRYTLIYNIFMVYNHEAKFFVQI